MKYIINVENSGVFLARQTPEVSIARVCTSNRSKAFCFDTREEAEQNRRNKKDVVEEFDADDCGVDPFDPPTASRARNERAR